MDPVQGRLNFTCQQPCRDLAISPSSCPCPITTLFYYHQACRYVKSEPYQPFRCRSCKAEGRCRSSNPYNQYSSKSTAPVSLSSERHIVAPGSSLRSRMDLLKLIQRLPFAPPIFSDETMDKFGEKVTLPHTTFPTRKCTQTNSSVMISP